MLDHIRQLMDAGSLLEGFGPWALLGMGIIVFIESGLLFPLLPGDSLLVTATMLRGQFEMAVWHILLVCLIAAILGDQIGFYLGHRFGRKLFKPEAKILKTKYLDSAEAFFRKHGPAALVIGRFVPIVRTYVPLAAGTAGMHYRHFIMWNVGGAIAWVGSMVAIGYFLGGIPGIAETVDGIIIGLVIATILPVLLGLLVQKFRMSHPKLPATEMHAAATVKNHTSP